MGFLELEDESDLLDKESIKVELLFVQDKLNAAEQDPSESLIKKPTEKKTKFLSMACEGAADSVGGSDESGGDRVYDAISEMNRYDKEKKPKADSDMQWWSENRRLYPCLSVLARKYLCIQATSTSSERVMSLMGNLVTKKRTLLTDEHVNMLTYLSDCY